MRNKAKIVITNRVHDEVRERLSTFGDVDMNVAIEPWPEPERLSRIRGATAVMGFMTDHVDASVLSGATELKIIACALKGFDSFDVNACTEAGVWVSIVPDLLTVPTAELGIGLAISLARLVRRGELIVRSGSYLGWRAQLYGQGLAGTTVAVIGLGNVGTAVVRCLSGFGCERILGVDPQVTHHATTLSPLADAMAVADYVFVAAPLTGESEHLISDAVLSAGKRGQFVINIGRGSVVDESAILRALTTGRIAGYAADVFEFEDWGRENRPMGINAALLAHPNTLFTPHLGSAVASVRLAIEQRAADNIVAVLGDRAPPDAVNEVMSTGASQRGRIVSLQRR